MGNSRYCVYDHVYYRLYKIMKLIEGESSITHISAALLWAFFQMQFGFLIFLVGLYFDIFGKMTGFPFGQVVFFSLGLVICSVNCMAISKGRHEDVVSRYSKQNYVTGDRIISTTLILSLVSMFIFAFLVEQKFPT